MGIEYSRSRKRRRSFKLLNIVRLIGGIIFVFILLEVGLLIISNITVKPVIAKWGLIEKGYWTDALFLRNEKVLTAPTDGYLTTLAEPGVRVQSGELVAYIGGPGTSQSSNTINQNINMQMHLLELNQERQDLAVDLQQIEAQIRYKYKIFNNHSKKVKEDLDSLKTEQARKIASVKEVEAAINTLEKSLGKAPEHLNIITAPQPGYLFYQLDNWEKEFDPENFLKITEPDLRRNYVLKAPGEQVKAGEIIGKIIDPFRQLIIIMLNPQLVDKPNPNESWWLKTGEGDFKITVRDLFLAPNGKTLIAFEDTAINHSFLPNRHAKVFAVYRRMEGICIPVKALLRKGPIIKVKVVNKDNYQLKDVQVLESDGEKAIVKGIDFGTIIISR